MPECISDRSHLGRILGRPWELQRKIYVDLNLVRLNQPRYENGFNAASCVEIRGQIATLEDPTSKPPGHQHAVNMVRAYLKD